MTYSSTILADAPTFWYRCNEASGTSAADSSGNSNTGTYTASGVTYNVTGAILGDADHAITVTSAGNVAAASGIIPAGSFSMECWFRTGATITTSTSIMANYSSNGGYTATFGAGFGTSATNSIYFAVANNANGFTRTTSYTISINTWYHLAGTYNSATHVATFYVNGVSVGSVTEATYQAPVGRFYIGTSIYADGQAGSYDEAAVYSGTVLTTARILAHYNAGIATTVTSSRTIPAVAALSSTSRIVPTGAALFGANIRTIPTKASIFDTNVRTIPTSAALFDTNIRTTPTSAALLGVTPLTLYGSTVTSAILSTANKLSTTTGGTSTTTTTTCSDTSGTHYWYMEVLAKGGSNGDVAALPAPTGKGWFYDTSLVGNTIPAGNWSAVVRLTDVTGFASTDLIMRVYVYNSGTYTAINTMRVNGVALTSTATNYTIPNTAFASQSFAANDYLYFDFWVFANGSGGHWSGDPIVNYSSSNGAAGIANQFDITTPGYIPNVVTSIHTIPTSVALFDTNVRTAPTQAALFDTNIRTAPTQAALFDTNIRIVLATAALSGTTRIVNVNVALLQLNNIRTINNVVALLLTKNRGVPTQAALNILRIVTAQAALLKINNTRTLPLIASITLTSTRIVPETTTLLQSNNMHTIPAIGALTTAPLLSGVCAVWANGTGGTAQYDSFRATQYPDPALNLTNTTRVASSLTQWTASVLNNNTLTVSISLDGVNWTPVTNGNAIPGFYAQPYPQIDVFATNSSYSYINTYRTGGSVALVTYDLTNNRLLMAGGVNGLYLFTAINRADVDLFCTSDQVDAGGLVFRFKDANNFYYLQIGDASSSVAANGLSLQKVMGNVRTTLATVPIDFVRGTYKTIRVIMVGGLITCSLDGNIVLTVTDTTPLSAGLMGLYNTSGSARYYQLRLQPLGDYPAGEFLYSKIAMSTTDPTTTPQLTDILITTRGAGLDPGVIIPQLHPAGTLFAAYYSNDFNTLVTSSANTENDYYWSIDLNGVLTFAARLAIAAPWCLTSADLLYTPTVQPTFSADLYRNRMTVTNCIGSTALTTEIKIADGNTTSWTVAYPIDSVPTITVEGILQTIGLQGIDTGKNFYWQPGSASIGYDTSLPPIINGYEIVVVYIGQFTTNVTGDNLPEQAARALVEIGTSGIVEAWENSPAHGTSTMTAEAAAIYIQGVLARYANNDAVMIQATTLRPGLAIGQMVSTFIPEFGLNNVQLFITKITTFGQQQGDGSILYQYQIEATNGANLLNWGDTFIGT